MEAKIAVETRFDESMIVQEIHGASNGESLVKSVIRLKEEGTRKALAELGYMEPAEAKALRARVAELEARAVVVPEPDANSAGLVKVRSWIGAIGPVGAMVWVNPWDAMKAAGVRTIPADRVLGERQVAVDREELDQLWWIEDPREWHESLEKLGAKNGFDALRTQAGKDGAA